MIAFWSAVISIVVAFVTTLATEPLRMFLYRNKHIKERRFANQADSLPRYIAALGWAASTCYNVNAGWQVHSDDPFAYTGRACEKLIEAMNTGIEVAYLFSESLKDEILTFGDQLKVGVNNYLICKNSVAPPPDAPTHEIRAIFSDLASRLAAKEQAMKREYRKMMELS